MTPPGFLAIWSDVPAAQETDYLHWLSREHTAERIGVPGFLGVRVFRARGIAQRRYFILYRLEQAGVVASPPYLARLAAPTPWSRRIMPVLGNFIRGGGSITAERGAGQGMLVAPVFCAAPDRARAVLAPLAALDRVAAVRLLEVDQAGTTIQTSEKALRGGDASFTGLLLIEALDEPALTAALRAVPEGLAEAPAPLQYEQVFALDRAGGAR